MVKKIVPVIALLAVLGGVYKFVLAKPAEAHKPKVDGEVYVLPRDFLLNLRDGQFVKLNVALVLEHGFLMESVEEAAAASGAGAEAASEPPEGFGTLPQEAVVRDIVTNSITGLSSKSLIRREGREKLKKRILRKIVKNTDVKAEDVLFTDVAVQ